MTYNLTISGRHYETLRSHLYPGDNKEAVAILICGRQNNDSQTRLLVNELVLIPYEDCPVRESYRITWSTLKLIPFLEKAAKKDLAIVKIHSHPNGFESFSETDDISDNELFESVFGWMNNDLPHASAIMLPNGEIFGRVFFSNLTHTAFNKINIVGDDLLIWAKEKNKIATDFNLRTIQAFGEGTVNILKGLKIAIVGCSGTGSPLIEQLVRLGVGTILLIDPDVVEKKNLNRILNSTMDDAINKVYKVDMLKNAIDRIGLNTEVSIYKQNIFDDKKIINDLASCDIIFGCVDSVDGRHLLNQIATFYLIAYFDLGVKLTSNGKGGIDQIMGSVHYLQPGGSSLRTRGVYTDEDLRAASIYRTDINFYNEQKKSGYIVDVQVDSPAVISINTQVASMATNEFLARIHPFRYDSNKEFAINRISLTDAYMQNEPDGPNDPYLSKFIGRGDLIPLLNMPEFN